MTTLTYDFDDNDFEYEVDETDYFDSLSNDELIETAQDTWDNMDADEQGSILKELELDEIDNGKPIWSKVIDTDKSWFYDMFIYDSIDEDALKDYFYDEAKESYDDAEAYRKDPYGYYGVSERDFF